MNNVALLYLLSEKQVKNIYDEIISTETSRKILARTKNISQTEYWQAQAAGFKPEIKFIIRASEYKNEKKLKYDMQTYIINRTYQDGSYMELVCYKDNKICDNIKIEG